jgi:hypothetical protein
MSPIRTVCCDDQTGPHHSRARHLDLLAHPAELLIGDVRPVIVRGGTSTSCSTTFDLYLDSERKSPCRGRPRHRFARRPSGTLQIFEADCTSLQDDSVFMHEVGRYTVKCGKFLDNPVTGLFDDG